MVDKSITGLCCLSVSGDNSLVRSDGETRAVRLSAEGIIDCSQNDCHLRIQTHSREEDTASSVHWNCDNKTLLKSHFNGQ